MKWLLVMTHLIMIPLEFRQMHLKLVAMGCLVTNLMMKVVGNPLIMMIMTMVIVVLSLKGLTVAHLAMSFMLKKKVLLNLKLVCFLVM